MCMKKSGWDCRVFSFVFVQKWKYYFFSYNLCLKHLSGSFDLQCGWTHMGVLNTIPGQKKEILCLHLETITMTKKKLAFRVQCKIVANKRTQIPFSFFGQHRTICNFSNHYGSRKYGVKSYTKLEYVMCTEILASPSKLTTTYIELREKFKCQRWILTDLVSYVIRVYDYASCINRCTFFLSLVVINVATMQCESNKRNDTKRMQTL